MGRKISKGLLDNKGVKYKFQLAKEAKTIKILLQDINKTKQDDAMIRIIDGKIDLIRLLKLNDNYEALEYLDVSEFYDILLQAFQYSSISFTSNTQIMDETSENIYNININNDDKFYLLLNFNTKNITIPIELDQIDENIQQNTKNDDNVMILLNKIENDKKLIAKLTNELTKKKIEAKQISIKHNQEIDYLQAENKQIKESLEEMFKIQNELEVQTREKILMYLKENKRLVKLNEELKKKTIKSDNINMNDFNFTKPTESSTKKWKN